MKQVRLGVFETNSSSMHSIVVTKDKGKYDKYDTDIYVDKTGEWNIWDDDLEFGRYPFRLLSSFSDKFYYALASLCSYYVDEVPQESIDMFNELTEIAKRYIKELKRITVPETLTGLPYYGCVDHESSSLLSRFLEDEHITIEEFLINKQYKVVIDGDEYCEFEKWVDSGLINKNNIEYEYIDGNKHEVK